jgi:hypothetical protein
MGDDGFTKMVPFYFFQPFFLIFVDKSVYKVLIRLYNTLFINVSRETF